MSRVRAGSARRSRRARATSRQLVLEHRRSHVVRRAFQPRGDKSCVDPDAITAPRPRLPRGESRQPIRLALPRRPERSGGAGREQRVRRKRRESLPQAPCLVWVDARLQPGAAEQRVDRPLAPHGSVIRRDPQLAAIECCSVSPARGRLTSTLMRAATARDSGYHARSSGRSIPFRSGRVVLAANRSRGVRSSAAGRSVALVGTSSTSVNHGLAIGLVSSCS